MAPLSLEALQAVRTRLENLDQSSFCDLETLRAAADPQQLAVIGAIAGKDGVEADLKVAEALAFLNDFLAVYEGKGGHAGKYGTEALQKSAAAKVAGAFLAVGVSAEPPEGPLALRGAPAAAESPASDQPLIGLPAPLDAEGLATEFIATAKSYGFDGYGGGRYWSVRTKRLALDSAKFAARIGLASDQQTADAIAEQMNEVMQSARSHAFDGFGGGEYWSRRCKEFGAGMTDLAGQIRLNVVRAGNSTAKSTNSTEAGLAAAQKLAADFTKEAKEYAFDGYGDMEYWSNRTKELAMESAMFAAQIALAVGPKADAAIKTQVEELLSEADDYAFGGYGNGRYWSRRCKELATTLIEIVQQIELSLVKAAAEG